jgi:MFS family permease
VPPPRKLDAVAWLICVIASIGFAFDIFVLLVLPLVIKPALFTLGGVTPGTDDYTKWARALFFIPAIAGGVFGLLGGYLTDLLGRRRVLTGSILLYAICAAGSGYATTLTQLLVLRCGVFIGVCVEFVAAVAWLAELFPNPRQRETILGYTQAFSSFGGLLVAGINVLAANLANHLPAIHGAHQAWRYTLIAGVIPAIPLIIIRPFLPESPVWQQKKRAGTLRRPNIFELFRAKLGRTTILTTIVFASSYGIAFGAIQQLPQILGSAVGGHKQVAAEVKAARDKAVADAKSKGETLKPERLREIGMNTSDETVARVSFWQETGGLVGRLLLAMLAVVIVSRRALMRLFQIPALIFVPLLFWWISRSLQADNLGWIKVGIFFAGMSTVAQFSFWGNYIPLVFPVHLRGTGESFAANIGGRIFGTLAAWITLTLAAVPKGSTEGPQRMAMMGAIVAGAYALIGTILTHWLPEPRHGEFDEGHSLSDAQASDTAAAPAQVTAYGPRP